MKLKGSLYAAVLAALLAGSFWFERRSVAEAANVQAPRFEVDPMWPKPLPNHWVMGNVIGLSVDDRDHVWIVHRAASLERMELYAQATPKASECCAAAPPVLEFDPEGNLVRQWGGPGSGYEWP